jgi:aminoglycoside phosphotransferase (APT) family kinase protein
MNSYQEIFQPIFDRLNFEPTKVFRDGPRFYVVGGEYVGEKAIFKSDVEVGPRRMRKARFRMRREALFLKNAKLKHTPKFYKEGVRKRFFWLLEGWVPGESQERGESTFLIKDSFFTKRNLDYLIEFLMGLRRLGENPPPQFEEQLPRYTLANYMNLIWKEREQLLGRELSERASAFLKARHKLFNASQTVITHHELYGPHIFVDNGKLNVIDWENVGWGNTAYDFTEVWIRSFAHSDFQGELMKRFRSLQDDKKVFDELFRVETVLQGIGNLKYFRRESMSKEELAVAEEASDFLRENIEKAVEGHGWRG